MDEGKSGWFSAKELAYLRDRGSIDSKHRSTVRNRIEEKVNEGVIHDIERIPELLDFLESTSRESIRLQSEPTDVGRGLGQIYTDQLPELMYGLLLSEMKTDETAKEFVERFDTIWEEVGAEVRNQIQNVQLSVEVRSLFRTFKKDLFEEVSRHVSIAHELWDMRIRIPRDKFVEWTIAQKGEPDFEYLPEVLDTAFGITVDDSPPRRFVDYSNLLIEAAVDSDIEPPDGTGWHIDPQNPTSRDREIHEAALSALDDELLIARHEFCEEIQVLERDQLLALGLYSYSKIESRDKRILDRIPCSNRSEGWNRYDTRRANIFTDNHNPPLLSRETISKQGTDEKKYEYTEYGNFVHWLTSYVEQKSSYSDVLRDFLREVPEDVVDEANTWISEQVEVSRRHGLDVGLLKQLSDAEDADENRLLTNFDLWFRAVRSVDELEWEDI